MLTDKKREQKPGASIKRKYHSKSRNGCSTCKKRRVKCDEQKPMCGICCRMKLTCGYLEEPEDRPAQKKAKVEEPTTPPVPETQQATPAKLPSPQPKKDSNLASMALGMGLLSAGNLNNLNLSHLVNSLSSAADVGSLGSLGNLASLNNLALLAQLPGDTGAISSQLNSLGFNMDAFATANVNSPLPRLDPLNAQAPSLIDLLQLVMSSGLLDPSVPSADSNPLSGAAAAAAAATSMAEISVEQTTETSADEFSKTPAPSLNMLDLRLMYHYTTHVSSTITGAGISDTDIWNHDIPMLAFEYPFLMHALLAFSATHLSRTESGLDNCVTRHRGDALRLLREAILDINPENTDALVASALILIMDSLANASVPSLTSTKSLPASAWIFHVKGAATILTAVWPLTEASRFYKFISVDLGDLGDIMNQKSQLTGTALLSYTNLECHDSSIADLYPVPINSPYLITLAYLNKLHKERYKADFILRIFAFPALLEKEFLGLLMSGDVKAMRIMRSYYKLLRSFTSEMKDKVWFLEGVSTVLPVDVEEYAGGAGGMHMMLDFLGGGPAIVEDHEVDKDLSIMDPGGKIADKLIDTNNLPSEITSTLDVMQGDTGIMEMKLD